MTTTSRSPSASTDVWDNTVAFGDDWVYDDYRLPDTWWNRVQQSGAHHIWTGEQGYYPYAMLARRLHQIPWYLVLTCVPLCGVKRCVNPSHLLLILENDLDDQPVR